MAVEKKIITISKEELAFLRKALVEKFGKAIDCPGDKSGYEELSQYITEALNLSPQQQKHSPGLLHKLLHDEGHNRDFLDTCYFFISDNQYNRNDFLNHIGLLKEKEIVFETAISATNDVEKTDWEKYFFRLLMASGVLLLTFLGREIYSYFSLQSKPIVWNMTTPWLENSQIQTAFLEKFVQQVEKETNGQLQIHIFPDFQLPTSNGHHLSKEEVRKALQNGEVEMIHSGPYIDFERTPEALLFSTLPFGKNYQEMVAWVRKPNIRETLKNLYAKEGILTFAGGHTGPQYGGWYRQEPTDSLFFRGKTVRFAGFAGYLLGSHAIGAKNKHILQHQYAHIMSQIQYDAIEWLNPEEDIKLGLHLKDFRYYDKSHWNEPNSLFLFYINQDAFTKLPKKIQTALQKVIDLMNEELIFKNDSESHQLAENTIENTINPDCNCKIQIFDLQRDCPVTYQFLKRQNQLLLNDFIAKNPNLKALYEDYCQ